MPYLIVQKNSDNEPETWLFRGIFGTRKAAKEAYSELDSRYGKFFYKKIEVNQAFPEGIEIEDLDGELK